MPPAKTRASTCPRERGDVIRSDKAAYPVDKHVKGERVGRVRRGSDHAEVGRACQRFPPGFLVENLLGAGYMKLFRGRRRELANIAGIVENQASSELSRDLRNMGSSPDFLER